MNRKVRKVALLALAPIASVVLSYIIVTIFDVLFGVGPEAKVAAGFGVSITLTVISMMCVALEVD